MISLCLLLSSRSIEYEMLSPNLPRGFVASHVRRLGTNGELTGAFTRRDGSTCAFIFRKDKVELIPPPSGFDSSVAVGVSKQEDVSLNLTKRLAGYTALAKVRGAIRTANRWTIVEPRSPYTDTFFNGITVGGIAYGTSEYSAGSVAISKSLKYPPQAILHSRGKTNTIGSGEILKWLDGGQGVGRFIPQLLSPAPDGTDNFQALRWTVNQRSVLLSGAAATCINSQGSAVGYTSFAGIPLRAIAFRGVQQILLHAPGEPSGAWAINSSGSIVGFFTSQGLRRAALWKVSECIDLNLLVKLPPNWQLLEAVDIDNSGRIAVIAKVGQTTRAVLLLPHPTPGNNIDSHKSSSAE